MATAEQIAAARQYAPPLISTAQADRRGAKLRTVNKQAVAYAQRAGMALEDVYPGGVPQVRALAPSEDSEEALAFVKEVGLSPNDVYSDLSADADFSGETTVSPNWKWAAVGFALGACVGGPLWALGGAVLGALK